LIDGISTRCRCDFQTLAKNAGRLTVHGAIGFRSFLLDSGGQNVYFVD